MLIINAITMHLIGNKLSKTILFLSNVEEQERITFM